MFNSEIKSKIGEDISILVKPENHPWNYICECGDASMLTVKEIQSCNAVFISHTHIDHFVNFDAVIRHQIGIQRRVIICGPKGISAQVQSRIKSYTWNLIEEGSIAYEIREFLAGEKVVSYELEPPNWELKKLGESQGNIIFEDRMFSVNAVLLNHKTPILAYKFKAVDTVKIDIQSSGFKGGKWVKDLKEAFEKDDRAALITVDGKEYRADALFHLLHVQEGDSLGVIMDHAATHENHAEIRNHFFRCRKVFIESFFNAEDKELAMVNHHSYSIASGKIMEECEVKEPVPVHFSRKYSEEQIEGLKREFEEAFKKETTG
jgi:ribonuclease Z